jgi:hypothetical protein
MFSQQGDVMNANWKNRLSGALITVVVMGGLIALARLQPVQAARDDASLTGPRYSVIETEAHNLIVTDNKSNTLFFYTIDKEKEVGSELKLRGTIDLNQVGKSTIMPTKAADK